MKVIQLFKNEAQLIKRAAKNNREAQQKLYERHSPKMLSVCRQYVKDLHDAEEVMLNGFLKGFNHLSDFRNDGSFEGWMRRIMVREAISFLRKQKKIEFATDFSEEVAAFSDPITSGFNAAHIQELIDSLPEGYRMVFVMYTVDGYKHSEIAKMLKISEGTSKSQLFKARKVLQEKLEQENKTGYGTEKI
ncbi:RNA polymerase sigma-70 factor, ECF subfamily [Salinimicrobium catena]|uniref:RNA polymerase sigma-70 factor, ECF subfamily n=1 Tax=Salinimicrobium catena TaxID=390640 RepID=A0A1H5NZN5_9FLAO|nr:RNA polymerase sigma factor [Salinimicrobium catena]SDL63536.1 RNA polymerase sigma-70 factor, ECF subfamily [Salinimicrobium catena]SEF07143.1 RNA polymerase sigma-70 factor, ECF subfamily [Salinimicrobium catena]